MSAIDASLGLNLESPAKRAMDLKSGYPYWAIKNGLMHAFPALRENIECEIAIIGAGISGALIADELAKHGHHVAVFEERDVGWGSSAASTALLQYEIDVHMIDLAKRYGENDATLAYQSCAQAIDQLMALATELGDVDSSRKQSLYCASKRRHVAQLHAEFTLRRTKGLAVKWLEPQDLAHDFGIDAPAAILSAQAAIVDPYRMTYRLLQRLQPLGFPIYDRTSICEINVGDQQVRLRTNEGWVIDAKYVILATGYAAQKWLKERVAQNRSSYAFISDPLDRAQLGPWKDTLFWESARPYLYMRATGDDRLLVGGADDTFDIARRRDLRVHKKASQLRKALTRFLPNLALKPAFAWAGTFAETKDGLPFFGPHHRYGPRVLFAMAYGGNGITYSMLGAGLLRAIVEQRPHPLSDLFGFSRLQR